MLSRPDVAVVGAGPIGLAIAWRCASRGLTVTVHDPAPGSGAVAVAAGMLAPVCEAYYDQPHLNRLLADSAARWPGFAEHLRSVSGLDIGYRTEGTLVVGLTGDDLARARRLWTYQSGLGLPVEPLLPTALREREPGLSPRVRGGAYARDDHQVDPRLLVTALRRAALGAGVRFVHEAVDPPRRVAGQVTVVAAGCGTAALTGLPIRPVKGQALLLRTPDGGPPAVRHVVRGHADGRSVYLVPRATGELVVGATVEERTGDSVTAAAVLDLLRAAVDLVPEVGEYDLVRAAAGARPGTPDNAPILGRLPDRPDVVVASGHYRHGVLLTPVTGDLVVDLLVTGEPVPALAPFAPDRFTAGKDPLAPDRFGPALFAPQRFPAARHPNPGP